jgi:hypothetical protein
MEISEQACRGIVCEENSLKFIPLPQAENQFVSISALLMRSRLKINLKAKMRRQKAFE